MPVPRQKEPFRFEAWCQRELSRLLKFSVEEDLVCYLQSMHTAKDVEEYLMELLGPNDPGGQQFLKEFLSHWRPPQRVPSPPSPLEDEILEELVRPQQEEMVLFRAETAGGKTGGTRETVEKQKGHKKVSSSSTAPPPGFSTKATARVPRTSPWSSVSNPSPDSTPHSLPSHPPPPGLPSLPTTTTSTATGKPSRGAKLVAPKKRKFVPLLSKEGQTRVAMHIPGRHACQCLAQKHDLINNCVECGRIVCAQEGPGPCVFCGALVFPPEEEQMLAKDSKKAQKVKEKLVKQYNLQDGGRAFEHFKRVQGTKGLQRAEEHKDKLLDFDQTSAQRTRVLDDDRDYFSVDATSWHSAGEREALQKREEEIREKRHGSRRNKAFTLDFAGRRVLEDQTDIELYDEANVTDLMVHGRAEKGERKRELIAAQDGIFNPSILTQRPKFKFTNHDRAKKGARRDRDGGEDKDEDDVKSSAVVDRVPLISRLQDRELQEMRDDGKCLSMHQPWATLLVEGIKRVEGRTWYTTHRGRLWIAATAKKPSPEEIQQQQDFYKALYEEEDILFPCDYPAGCLLGCVDVTDCLSQEEYREKYPDGESESPYVFVCENPQQLTVKLPVKGQHKIWKLPKDLHSAAKLSCRPSTLP